MQRYTETTDYKDMISFFNICKDSYWKRIAMGLYYTGCRAGEVIQITNEDINNEDSKFLVVRIHTEKNPHAPIRYVPINNNKESYALGVFKSSLDSEYIFPSYKKEIKTNSYLRVMRKKFNEFWGVAPHYFRHCRLTHMVTEFDFNDQELVKYAGWCDSKPAKWYMSLKTTDLQRKMEMKQ